MSNETSKIQYDVLIVGGGHAGAQCAISLRQLGFDGSIAIIGKENVAPYERPPLSKDYFSREKAFERLYIRPVHFWAERNIDLLLGTEVVKVDPLAKLVTFSDGRMTEYGKLVWAAGAEPRSLPGERLGGVHTIRTRDDCDRLMAEIDAGASQIAIIGGGYIGLEAAAVLTKLGCAVTLLEAAPRVLARVAGAKLSAFYEAEHRAQGVDLRVNTKIAGLLGQTSVEAVKLEDGTTIPVDAVIVGIGVDPVIGPLVSAGADAQAGAKVDSFCQTSLPDVYAIGDCAAFENDYAEGLVTRIESVQNANDQAACVAKHITGHPVPYTACPWFWSNQYDLRLQTVGLSTGYDQAILRGSVEERSFSIVYLKHDRVIALDCVNRVKDYVQGKKLVEERRHLSVERLADADLALSEMSY